VTAPVTAQSHGVYSGDRGMIRLGLLAALASGIGVGAVTAFMFALRFGAVAGALTVVLLLAGISVRRLTGLAMLGVLAIPVLYLLRPAHNYGGFSFDFSLHQILANWIGAGVLCALIAAGLLQVHELRGPRPATARRRRAGRHQAPDGAETSAPMR
jgi:hypothetical protein